MNENRHRPIQFSLRSLLGLTLVVSVAFSLWRSVGLEIALLIVVLIVATKCIAASNDANRDRIEKPLLALAAVMSCLILPFLFVVTFLRLALVALAWFYG